MPVDPTQSTWPDDPQPPAPPGEATVSLPPTGDSTEPPTEVAPPFRPVLPLEQHRWAGLPGLGQRIEDFELIRVLGQGSFGIVFLARQISLDRRVVVKVTANAGNEAQTLASLEHDHIVSVYSETVLPEHDLRLMCMQYVPGTTLERIIELLGQRPRSEWSGQAILDIIDQCSIEPAVLHPSALRDRQLLAQSDLPQAVCRLGAQLAEALDYAHSQDVLHRDIKPANILVNQYGKPLLADFNLSFRTRAQVTASVGGTLIYMAPEHLDAFNPHGTTPPEAVDRRSDIYSLGVVLFELLTGRWPFATRPSSSNVYEALRQMTVERREAAPSARKVCPDVPEMLDHVLRRCLDPDPARRYQTGAALARALESCRELRRRERDLPAPGPLTRRVLRRPFVALLILCLLPHVVGSVVNVWYNLLEVIGELTPAQHQAFHWLVLGYNAVVYPASLAVVCGLFLPVYRVWRVLLAGGDLAGEKVDAVRRKVLTWPRWAVGLSCAGWLPGGIVFPLGIHFLTGPVDAPTFGHFLVSFTISGLIALTYSYFAAQYVVLRALYPRLWLDADDLRHATRAELQSPGPRLRLFQLLAGTIPLAGALLLLGVEPEVSSDWGFRLLITALILLGMAGFGLAIVAHNYLSQTLAALTGARHE